MLGTGPNGGQRRLPHLSERWSLGGRARLGSHRPSPTCSQRDLAGVQTGSRGWCGQALAIGRARQSLARQHMVAATGGAGAEDNGDAGDLLQQGWGPRGHTPLTLGSGSELRPSFWRRSSTPRPQTRGQIRHLGTNRKALSGHPHCHLTPGWQREGRSFLSYPSKSVACS